MTRINPDDPKWTAYVFGELNDSERAAVEQELEVSEEARMLVEELRFAAAITKVELREAVTVTPLTPEQRKKIHASAKVVRHRRWFGARSPLWAAGLAATAAALVVLAVVVVPSMQPLQKTASTAPPIFSSEARQPDAPPPAVPADAAQREFSLSDAHSAAPPVTSPVDELKKAPSSVSGTASQQVLQVPQVAAAEAVTPEVPAAAPVPAFAEPAPKLVVSATGRVFGTVQDASGAYIPGVSVTATNLDSGRGTTTVTNGSGAYSFNGLQPGSYQLRGSLSGFQTSVYNSVPLLANAQAKQDMTLQIGSVAQNVEVPAGAAKTLDIASTTVGRKDEERSASKTAGLGVLGGALANSAPAALSSSLIGARAPGVPPAFDRGRAGAYTGTDAYDAISDNPFLRVAQNPLSTLAIDVDNASYSDVRRYLNQSQMPPKDAVRIGEMINYFVYDYPQPQGNNPIGASIEAASAPWNPQHRLVRVGIKARDIEARRRPPSNLVFLINVSGSMQPAERLPLLKDGIRMLVEQLRATDRVTVVTYGGTTGVALRPTRGDRKDDILRLIDSLQTGGSTNGSSGIQLAYQQAMANFISGGVNRVILATDGDVNAGITDRNALLRLIEDRAKGGVFLSVLGVGSGKDKDATLETLADRGHGHYAYLDTLNEARKVLVDQMSGTLVTVAKDVKVQVAFNPAVVDAYRLIGYENRPLRNEDFKSDLNDGGDMGAGHTVTVLYEVVPRGVAINPGTPGVDPLQYKQTNDVAVAALPRNASNETLTVNVRYKEPAGSDSKLLVFPLVDREQTFAKASVDFRFAAAVASFGMILRDSPYKGLATIDSVLNIAEGSLGPDRNGYRREFLQLVQRARQVRGR